MWRRREQRKPSGLSRRAEEGRREGGMTDIERGNSRRTRGQIYGEDREHGSALLWGSTQLGIYSPVRARDKE